MKFSGKIFMQFVFIGFGCIFFAMPLNAQDVEVQYISKAKEKYLIGDTVQLKITLQVYDATCEEGMHKTKVFQKGVKIIDSGVWVNNTKNYWVNQFTLLIVGNNKNDCSITIFRRTDKDNILHQINFKN